MQLACIKFKSPTFAVAKKDGGIQLIQDFQALNAKTSN
jgi:hypothetical protein